MHVKFPRGVFGDAIFAVLQAISMAFIGTVLAKMGVIDTATKSVLAKVSMKVLIPCLLFSNLLNCPQGGPSQDPALCPDFITMFRSGYPFLILPFAWVFIGLIVGYLAAVSSGAPSNLRCVIMSACAFGNSTGLPIVLFSSIAAASTGFTHLSPDLQERQFLIMLSLYQMTYPILQWSLGTWIVTDKSSCDDESSTDTFPNERGEDSSAVPEKSNKLKTISKVFFTPPVVAILVAALIVGTPEMRGMIVDVGDFDNDAILGWGFNAITNCGKAAVPVNMLVLGAGLASIPDFSRVHWPSAVAATIGKLFVCPGIAFSCVAGAHFSGITSWMMPAPHLRSSLVVVACIVTATPTANNLAVMMEACGSPERKECLSAVIFLMYCVAPFSLTAWIAVAVKLGSLA